MQLFPLSRFIYQLGHRIVQKIRNESFPFNNKGFGGGGGDTPSVPAAPAIAPSPVPTETTPGATLEGRQRQVAMLKYGSLSTISNAGGSAGITGTGPDMYPSMTAGTAGRQTTGGQ
jgi:hypothetical protein